MQRDSHYPFPKFTANILVPKLKIMICLSPKSKKIRLSPKSKLHYLCLFPKSNIHYQYIRSQISPPFEKSLPTYVTWLVWLAPKIQIAFSVSICHVGSECPIGNIQLAFPISHEETVDEWLIGNSPTNKTAIFRCTNKTGLFQCSA